jgi:hypothetical protein
MRWVTSASEARGMPRRIRRGAGNDMGAARNRRAQAAAPQGVRPPQRACRGSPRLRRRGAFIGFQPKKRAPMRVAVAGKFA